MDSGVAEELCIPSPAGKRGQGVRAAFPGRGPPDLSLDPGRRERGTKPAGVSVEVQAAGGCREHVLMSQGTQRRGRAVVTASESPPSPPLPQSPCLHARPALCPAPVLVRTRLCDAAALAAAEPVLVWTSVCLLEMCGL